MVKVAFFLDNNSIYDIDTSSLELGNPGIGGTEYLILLVSFLLSCRDNGIEVRLYMRKKQHGLPDNLSFFVVDSIEDAISHAEKENYNAFVLKHDAAYIKKDSLKVKEKMDLIVWCHVFVCYWELDYYAKNTCVKRVVHVGREALDLYRDHPVFEKSTYIYNVVNIKACRENAQCVPFVERKHIVTYIGSLVPYKGFHLLALAWPEILKKVPDAQLYVIGNAKLYNSYSELGPLGLASPEYERIFLSSISENGELRKSVHLMGRMGKEKTEILQRTKVGVPNPSGITETFCLSAVELQAMGARIATIKAPGYLDTVVNGILYNDPKDLANSVIDVLLSKESDYAKAVKYFEREFSPEVILKKWERLLRDDIVEPILPLRNSSYRGKWIKEWLRILKKHVVLLRCMPPLERVLLFFERRIINKMTYMDSNINLG